MFANVKGKKIFFETVGEGLESATPELKPRPTFVVLHCASGFDHGYLRGGLDVLSLFGQVVYLDLPGAGRSWDVDLNTVTLESMADDVSDVIDYLGIKNSFILGHCAGGFVAQHFAIRHPEKLCGLLLINTAPSYQKIHDDVPNPLLSDRAPEDVVKTCLRVYAPGVVTEETLTPELVGKMMKEVGPYFFAPDNMKMAEAVFSFTGMNVAMLDRFVTELYPAYDLRSEVHNITAPTLIISGDQDWLTTPSGSRFLHQQIVNSAHIEFEDTCHLAFAEAPKRFFDTVQGFVRRHHKG